MVAAAHGAPAPGGLSQLSKLRPTRVGRRLVVVRGRIGVIEGDPADRTQAPAIRTAQELEGKRESEGIVRPGAQIQLIAVDVRAAQLLVLRCGLLHLARVDLDRHVGVGQAAHARPGDVSDEPQSNGVARRGARDVQARGDGIAGDHVPLSAQLELARVGVDLETFPLTRAERETSQIDAVISPSHPAIEVSGHAKHTGRAT